MKQEIPILASYKSRFPHPVPQPAIGNKKAIGIRRKTVPSPPHFLIQNGAPLILIHGHVILTLIRLMGEV
jgi:hypothetical protein